MNTKIEPLERKEVFLTVRTTKENKEWMDKNNVSPSLLFDEAVKDIKEKIRSNIKRKKCVVCGKNSREIRIGLGIETFSFCSKKCMAQYNDKIDPLGNNIEVKGTKLYVK